MSNTNRRREIRASINQYGVFPVTVTRVQHLTPTYTRISLSGRSLHHAAQPISNGTGHVHDAYIKLLIPPAGSAGPTMIELDSSWRTRWLAAPPTERGHMRTYTISNSRLIPAIGLDESPHFGMLPAADADLSPLQRPLPSHLQPEIDLDIALHPTSHQEDTEQEETGHKSPGSSWAAQAKIGQPISLLAPLHGSGLWSSWAPGNAIDLLLLGDETAAPAILSILRSLPPTAHAAAYLEIPDTDAPLRHLPEVQALQEHLPNSTLNFLPRTHQDARGQLLATALRHNRGLTPPDTWQTPDDATTDELIWHLAENPHDTYVFIAGESTTVKTLRRICVTEAGISKDSISFMGYWKKGKAEG